MQLPASKMEDVGQVASHNSMELSFPDWTTVLDHVNAVELDVWPWGDWQIGHGSPIGGSKLTTYLELLNGWRTRNNNHPLLTVFLEIKDDRGFNVDDFHSILQTYFPEAASLFRPSDLRDGAGSDRTLRQIVSQGGWPLYSKLQGKVMFVINSGSDEVITSYVRRAPVIAGGEICFGMLEPNNRPDGWEQVVLFNEVYDSYSTMVNPADNNILRRAWQVTIGNAQMEAGDLEPARNAMVSKKIHFLAYDKVQNAFSTAI